MNKLSLEALKMRAEAIASEDLLATISGGTENSCHDGGTEETTQPATPSTSWEIEAGVEIPVGGQPTYNLGIKIKF
ncbi:MAG: hypothetical protein WCY06_05670 [Flavobacteriaceae bacterium]